MSSALHVRGVVLPETEQRDLWIVDGRITFEAVPGAETVASPLMLPFRRSARRRAPAARGPGRDRSR